MLEDFASELGLGIVWRCGIPLLSRSDALKLLAALERRQKRILGVDGFWSRPGEAIEPDMQAIGDFSAEPSVLDSIAAAMGLVQGLTDRHLIELTLG